MLDSFQIQSYETPEIALLAASEALLFELRHVVNLETLLLLAGGSATKVYASLVSEINNLPDESLAMLSIAVEDERWPVKNNTLEIKDTGFIQACQSKGAYFYELEGENQETAASNFEKWLKTCWQKTNLKTVAVIGIGADGHTLSVNADPKHPEEFTALFESEAMVVSYHSKASTAAFPKFPDRITLTLSGLKHIDQALGLVAGSDKQKMLQTLLNESLPYCQQPAQALKQIPTGLFTDQNLKI